jgi:hypothetical protein
MENFFALGQTVEIEAHEPELRSSAQIIEGRKIPREAQQGRATTKQEWSLPRRLHRVRRQL